MVKILLSKKLGELRWSQAYLSEVTGIRPGTISDYYWDEAGGIKMEHIDLLCEALHCDLSELIEVTPNDPPLLQNAKAVPKPRHKCKRKVHK